YMNHKILIILLILIVLAGIWLGLKFIINGSPVDSIVCTMDAKLCSDGSYVSRIAPKCDFMACPETRIIKLYYYNYELDRDEWGNTACSRNGLVAVEREISITQTPIQDAVKLLLSGELTEEERAQGIDTEYPLEGLLLKGALLKDGVLTLEFDDSKNRTVGGSCRVGILWFQIEATAKQFPEVQHIRFLPKEIFQP
ncbi:GerMN domain-containing protein, partial [Patescibacteria group bacterium]|nr:GerMN domain-containing protein [Patescibacteria group bacterium]